MQPVLAKIAHRLRDDGNAKLAVAVLSYWQQYLGRVVEEKKLIEVFLACRIEPAWHEKIWISLDGGDCLIDALYDPEKRQVVRVDVHR